MPRLSSCSYSNCTKGYTKLESPTKSQVNHIYNYHKDVPATFECTYTGRPLIFRRCATNDMDYVCFCKSTITVRSNLKRHYELCRVAEAAAKAEVMDGALDLDVDNSSDPSGFVATSTNCAPLRPRPRSSKETQAAASERPTKKARITGPSNVNGQPPSQQMKPFVVEAHTQPPASDHMQYLLKKSHQPNLHSSSSHHNQPISSKINHRRPAQSLSGTSTTCHQLMKALTDSKAREDYMMRETLATIIQLTNQWRHLMEFVNGNHNKLLCSLAQQQRRDLYAQSEQHRQLLGASKKNRNQVCNAVPHHRLESSDSTSKQSQRTRVTIKDGIAHRRETGRSCTAQEGVPYQPARENLLQEGTSPGPSVTK